MSNHLNLAGERFGKLVAVELTGEVIRGQGRLWRCVCDCGGEKKSTTGALNIGAVKSCGCLVLDNVRKMGLTNYKHGEGHAFKTKEYRAWSSMKERCNRASHPSYLNYGGRGIKLCAEWENSYTTFLRDMGRAQPGQSIDRIDVDKGYSPDNCRWASVKTQMRNKSNTRFMIVNGKKRKAIEVAEEIGVDRNSMYIYLRIQKLIGGKYGNET